MADYISYYLNSGSGRVLNCMRIANEIQAAGTLEAGPLLFMTPLLNRCVLIKDIYIKRNRSGNVESASVKTKLYLPYNKDDLSEGGLSVFVATADFQRSMAELLDMTDATRREQFAKDQATLDALDTLPTFAPFLLKDCLSRAHITANPHYYQLPEDEWKRTYDFVQHRFRKIMSAILPGSSDANPEKFDRLLSRLWELNDPVALNTLANAFQLPEENREEAFYSWKGIIFLSYEYGRRKETIEEFLEWLQAVATQPAMRPDPRDKETPERAMHVLTYANRAWRDVREPLSDYEGAFEDLFVTGKGAERFNKFLLNAGELFQTVGINLGRLSHAYEVWDFTSSRFQNRRMHYEVFRDLFHVLEDILGAVDEYDPTKKVGGRR